MAKDTPINPATWTLRFKHGKHTILLFAEPLTPFSALKTELLTTLRERYPSGLPSAPAIPDSIDEVLLGVPIDVYEPSKGWVEITTDGGAKESPKSLGLKNGSVIAFAFVEGGKGEDGAEGADGVEFNVQWSTYEDQYADEMDDDAR